MANVEVFVWELCTVYGKAASTVMVSEVSALRHKVLDHSMEGAAFVGVLVFVVTSAQRPKVFSGLWDVICIKLEVKSKEMKVLPQIESLRSGLRFLRL